MKQRIKGAFKKYTGIQKIQEMRSSALSSRVEDLQSHDDPLRRIVSQPTSGPEGTGTEVAGPAPQRATTGDTVRRGSPNPPGTEAARTEVLRTEAHGVEAHGVEARGE